MSFLEKNLFFVFALVSVIYGCLFMDMPTADIGIGSYLKSHWMALLVYAQVVLTPFFFVKMGINRPGDVDDIC